MRRERIERLRLRHSGDCGAAPAGGRVGSAGRCRLASYDAEDASYDNVSGATMRHGRAAIQGFLTAYFAPFSGGSVRFTDIFARADHATAEWIFSWTYTGQFPGLPSGAGQAVSFRGVAVLTLSGGLIAADTGYVDYIAIFGQLGLLPGGTGTPVASPTA